MSDNALDMMLVAIEKAGYALVWLVLANAKGGNYGMYEAHAPDGWVLRSKYPACKYGTPQAVLAKHELIQKAYAHYGQMQELERARKQVADLSAKVKQLEGKFQKAHGVSHAEKAKRVYELQTHPHIVWAMQESGLSVAHAIAYDNWSWCEERGFGYTIANPEQSGVSKCSRCIRLLEENGIKDY